MKPLIRTLYHLNDRKPAGNKRLAQWRLTWLIEHSTSHQLLWCIDSFMLRNPPLRQAPPRCGETPLRYVRHIVAADYIRLNVLRIASHIKRIGKIKNTSRTMNYKILIMRILSGIFGLWGCDNKSHNNSLTQTDNSKIKIEQKEGFTEIETGDNNTTTLNIEQDSLCFLPIIRNYENEDMFTKTIVYQKLGDNIGAFVAKVTVQTNGKTGIDYVLKSDLSKYKISEEHIFRIGLNNLKNAKLKIEGMNDPKTGDNMISVSSQIGLATCILYDFNFIDKLSNDLQTKELHVTIINSGTVYLTTPNNSFEKSFEKIALESSYNDVLNINSSTYLWTNNTLKLIKKYRD